MIIKLTVKDAELLKNKIGSSIINRLDEHRNFFTALDENRYFLTFHWLDEKKAMIYADTEDFIIVTDSEALMKYADDIDTTGDGILQFHEYLLELTSSDTERLESLENMIITLEERLLTEAHTGQRGISDILKVRRDLLKTKRYYERMEFLTDEMTGIDPAFGFIDRKFHRLLEFTLHLQEYIDQVREAYQAQIDIEQNSIMKVFTVVTSVFMPLTLISGWYGMNLPMPRDFWLFGWLFGWPFVIGLNLTVVFILIVLFKKKKWF